jgi:hypothetical protein
MSLYDRIMTATNGQLASAKAASAAARAAATSGHPHLAAAAATAGALVVVVDTVMHAPKAAPDSGMYATFETDQGPLTPPRWAR